MVSKWCYNAKTGNIFEYTIFEDETTDFPRGTYLVDYDSLVSGFVSYNEALAYSTKAGYCPKCKCVRTAADEKRCPVCSSVIEFRHKKQE